MISKTQVKAWVFLPKKYDEINLINQSLKTTQKWKKLLWQSSYPSRFLAFNVNLQAQKQIERKKISGKYNQEQLNLLKKSFQEKSSLEKQRAIKIAKEKGWKVKLTNKKGDLLELQKIINKKPIYYPTFNVAAAKSTRVVHLNSRGSLGVSLDGQNMTAYVWDGGLTRASHQEYDGAGGNNRFSSGDSRSLNYHSVHVKQTPS